MSVRALFGGTFDPIHLGHINTATALIKELGINELHLMPNAIPPHRAQPTASAEQRLAMVKLACEQQPELIPEAIELTAEQPSYTVKTLRLFSQRYPADTLLFVMGMDSLISLDSWYQWRQLTKLAHLIVLPRPDYNLRQASKPLQHYIAQHQCHTPQTLQQAKCGYIYVANTPMIDISATAIRTKLKHHTSTTALPPKVVEYIQQQQLYR